MAHPFQADITPSCTRRGTLVHVAGGATAAGRTHAGTSAGGRITLYVGLERGDLFGNIAMLSPAFRAPPHYLEPYFSGTKRPTRGLRVWLSAGAYEGGICADTRAMERYFKRVGTDTESLYTHEGHSFGTWRNATVAMLQRFFGLGTRH